MNLRNIDLNLLPIFDAVMSEQNISRAAEKVGMTQPAVSLAIERFRSLTNDRLFERTGHGMKPTRRAMALSGPIRRALATVSSVIEHGTEFDFKHSDRSFNLALGDYGELILLPQMAQELQVQSSNIRIQTVSAYGLNMEKELYYENIDIYLWVMPIENKDIRSVQIGKVNEVCLVRQDHPIVGEAITIAEYAELKHVTLTLPQNYGPSLIDRELWRHGLLRKPAITVSSLSQIPRIVSSTDMIATLPKPVADAYATVHNLKTLAIPVVVETPIFMMWNKIMEGDIGHKWLRDRLMAFHKSSYRKSENLELE